MISTCHVSGQELSRYRDREGSSAQLAELDEHVAGCERCKLRLADAASLSRLFSDQFQQIEQELPRDFAASVMSRVRAAQPRRSWLESLVALLPPRRELTFGMIGLAVAASLAIVFAPSLRSQDDRLLETTENEAQIHSIEVTSPDRSAVVFDSAEGNTVIWMVPSEGDGGGGQTVPSEP
jgi:anti-sigma factor RsiW